MTDERVARRLVAEFLVAGLLEVALFEGVAPRSVEALVEPVRTFDLQRDDFLSIIDGMAKYQDPDWKDQRPPTLIGEGARARTMRSIRQIAAAQPGVERVNDLGNRNAVPVPKQEYDRMREKTLCS